MIRLASVFEQFKDLYLSQYDPQILPSQKKALEAIIACRSRYSPLMQTRCNACDEVTYTPHSCGHRQCPHCQAHESQEWIERQQAKKLPVDYFMITFTLPKEFRTLAYNHQRDMYRILFECVWKTLQTFGLKDKALNGLLGMIAVLHTHSRRLDYHPHIHTIIPAGAIDKHHGCWQIKKGTYLFPHKALASMFRGKMLAAIKQAGLSLPKRYPTNWVVDCQHVGAGDKAIIYLGRYLYRGVIQEKDIVSCDNGQVTFRYIDSKTKKYQTQTLSGADFIHLVLQHVLPRRFRRSREYGFLHPNSKKLMAKIQSQLNIITNRWVAREKPRPAMTCRCCGGILDIIKTRIKSWGRGLSRFESFIPIPKGMVH